MRRMRGEEEKTRERTRERERTDSIMRGMRGMKKNSFIQDLRSFIVFKYDSRIMYNYNHKLEREDPIHYHYFFLSPKFGFFS